MEIGQSCNAARVGATLCLFIAVIIYSALLCNALLAFIDYVDTSDIDDVYPLRDAPKTAWAASVQATGVHFTGTSCRSIFDPMAGLQDTTCPMELECQAALRKHMRPSSVFDGCDSFVSWLRVSLTDGQHNFTRCAFKYGTPATSTEEDVGISKRFPGSHPVGSTLQVWTMGTNHCVVGVDSLNDLIAKEARSCGHSDGILFHKIPCGPLTIFWFLVSLSPLVLACILIPIFKSRQREGSDDHRYGCVNSA